MNFFFLLKYFVFISFIKLLCLIGEAFDEMSYIVCGAVVSVRAKGNKLGLWTRDAGNGDANIKIG